MRISSILIVLFGFLFLQGCILTPLSLLTPAIGVGTSAAESAFYASKPEGKKVSEDELSKLKPGMTLKEVNAILQRKPMSVFPYADGSMAIYSYNTNKHHFAVIQVFGENEIGNQTVTVLFDLNEKYVRHTFSEMKMCGSGFSGISQENCEKEEQQAVAN